MLLFALLGDTRWLAEMCEVWSGWGAMSHAVCTVQPGQACELLTNGLWATNQGLQPWPDKIIKTTSDGKEHGKQCLYCIITNIPIWDVSSSFNMNQSNLYMWDTLVFLQTNMSILQNSNGVRFLGVIRYKNDNADIMCSGVLMITSENKTCCL